MSLADKISSVLDGRHNDAPANVCSLCWVLQHADDEDHAALLRAIESTMTGRELSEVLGAEGYSVSDRAVQRHRRSGHHVAR